MKKQKYIYCDNCGKRIYFGDVVYAHPSYCGVYCSGQCYADSYAEELFLNEEEADNRMCVVFEEEIVGEG